MNLSPDPHKLMTLLMEDVQIEGSTPVKMPHLIGANPMKPGKIAGFEEIVDTGCNVSRPVESTAKCSCRHEV
jgi:hypothetical protein